MTTKIFLDSGHGGKDFGAVGNSLHEKNVTLDIAKRIGIKLKQYKNVEVMFSRSTDISLDLPVRTKKANKWGADVFVSIHVNSADSGYAKGFESYVYNGTLDPGTIAFQNVMHQEIYKKLGNHIPNRGKKRANFHVLGESNMKALLVENLFLSNIHESALLKKSSFLDSLAQGYVNGLEKFFGLVKEIRPPTNGSAERSTLYQVIAGTFSDEANAESLVKKLLSNGYSAYVQEK